uniref:Uncharacterized protein n=1 Tax=Anopheles stephensi TaxID=30069 RepID=A0A182XVJ2_ANOST
MSWFQNLAGKAENILTKIDQNAATVLQTRPTSGDVEGAPLLEVSVMTNEAPSPNVPKPRMVVSKSSLLSKKMPKGMVRSASNASYEKSQEQEAETQSVKSEKQNISGSSSRRSSLTSKKDGTVIDMSELVTNHSSHDVREPNYSIEKEMAALKIVLAEIKAERDELKGELDAALSQQLSNGETESKLLELEVLCQNLSTEKNSLAGKLLAIDEVNSKYVKSISELESTIAKHIQSEQELNGKLETAKLETENVLSELQQYRVRAHATLQLKEKTIEQLKEQMNGSRADDGISPNDATVSSAEQILQIELEQTRQEKANLLEELNNLNERMRQREAQWLSNEEKLRLTVNGLEQNGHRFQQQVSFEMDKFKLLEDDFHAQQKELASAREELIKQRTSFTMRLHEKESEINKLRNKIHNRPVSPLNDHEDRDADPEKVSKKELLIGRRKDKKEKKTAYATLEGESSPEEELETKSPSKTKKSKTFKFPTKSKEKREKSREKDREKPESSKPEECVKAPEKGDKDKDKKKDKEKKEKEKKDKSKDKKDKKLKQGSVSEEVLELGDAQPIFGVSLGLATERSRCHDGVNLPLVVRDCIDYLQEHGLQSEQIYKVEAVKTKLQQLKRTYNNREGSCVGEMDVPIACGLLKMFLRELPEPILTTDLSSRFEEVASHSQVSQQEQELVCLVEQLPSCNRTLLSWMFMHVDAVTQNEDFTKMNAQNIAMLLSPTLQMSHRLFVAILCHCSTLFADTNLHK